MVEIQVLIMFGTFGNPNPQQRDPPAIYPHPRSTIHDTMVEFFDSLAGIFMVFAARERGTNVADVYIEQWIYLQ